MTTTKCKLGDGIPLTPEEIAHLNTLANLRNEDIDCSDPNDYEATNEELACAVRLYDYPTMQDAINETLHLMEMHKNGMSIEEIQIYKKSRIKQLTTA